MRLLKRTADPDPRSILVVLPTWVGDFVMATPALRAVRNRFPDAHITFLLEPNLRELVRGGDWMNECIEWPEVGSLARTPFRKAYRDLVWDLRRRHFDWAVLFSNSFRAALLARLCGASRRIGYERDGRGWLLTDPLAVPNRRPRATPTVLDSASSGAWTDARPKGVPVRVGNNLPVKPGRFVPLRLVEYYADLVEAIGCDRPDDQLELFTTADGQATVELRLAALGISEHHPLVVISPGARYGAAKCWLPERFADAADRLVQTWDAAAVITCGPGEETIARQIGVAMRQQRFIFDDPRLTLGELKALIRRSDLLLCNDAGPRHFAKAFGVAVVTVFGPTHPEWTATGYQRERIVRINVDCGPCQQRVCPLGHGQCMSGVTVDMVVAACGELLNLAERKTPSPRRGPTSLAAR